MPEHRARAEARRLALVGGMLLDGYEAPPIHHAAVLIEGDRIVRVGPAAGMTIPPGYTVVDTSGRTKNGTRWQADMRSTRGYTAVHPPGL